MNKLLYCQHTVFLTLMTNSAVRQPLELKKSQSVHFTTNAAFKCITPTNKASEFPSRKFLYLRVLWVSKLWHLTWRHDGQLSVMFKCIHLPSISVYPNGCKWEYQVYVVMNNTSGLLTRTNCGPFLDKQTLTADDWLFIISTCQIQ